MRLCVVFEKVNKELVFRKICRTFRAGIRWVKANYGESALNDFQFEEHEVE